MKPTPVQWLLAAAQASLQLASAFPSRQHQQIPLREPSPAISTPHQFGVAEIRSEVAQGISLFCLLVDEHRFAEMHKVFTIPAVHIDLPEDGFRDITQLETFVQNLYIYADYPFQHLIGVPVVEVDESMDVAHATSPLIATVFDRYDGERARPNEVEYGFYVTDHVLTEDGWRMQNMSAKPLGIYTDT